MASLWSFSIYKDCCVHSLCSVLLGIYGEREGDAHTVVLYAEACSNFSFYRRLLRFLVSLVFSSSCLFCGLVCSLYNSIYIVVFVCVLLLCYTLNYHSCIAFYVVLCVLCSILPCFFLLTCLTCVLMYKHVCA